MDRREAQHFRGSGEFDVFRRVGGLAGLVESGGLCRAREKKKVPFLSDGGARTNKAGESKHHFRSMMMVGPLLHAGRIKSDDVANNGLIRRNQDFGIGTRGLGLFCLIKLNLLWIPGWRRKEGRGGPASFGIEEEASFHASQLHSLRVLLATAGARRSEKNP